MGGTSQANHEAVPHRPWCLVVPSDPAAFNVMTTKGSRPASTSLPLIRPVWRSRRAAAVAGIVFAVLLITAMIMMRLALSSDSYESLHEAPQRCTLIKASLHLIPFAGIAFLWFVGVVREQIGEVEDRLFSTVFLGSGLLFLAMLFVSYCCHDQQPAADARRVQRQP